MNAIFTFITTILGAIALVFILSLVLSLPVYWLWNWLVPSIFALREITWGEAWGLLLLTGFLFRNSSSNKSNK